MVVIALPSTCTASTLQLLTVWPSTSTVHAPQLLVSQPDRRTDLPGLLPQVVHQQQPGLDVVRA